MITWYDLGATMVLPDRVGSLELDAVAMVVPVGKCWVRGGS